MIYNRHDVIRIVATTLNSFETELNEESGLSRTLNWDSLNHVIILTSIEDYFGIKIEDAFFAQLLTLGKILEFLDAYKK